MKNKSILISINTSWNIYHFRSSLLHALKADGYTIIAAAPQDAYSERLRSIVDQYIPLPMDNAGTSPMRDLLLWLRYVRLLKATKPSVVLTYTVKPNIYGALAARLVGVPIIANVSGLGTSFIRRNWLTFIVRQLYRVAFHKACCIFFQNPHDRDLFINMRLVTAEQAGLLNGSGVDLDYFHPRYNQPRKPDAPLRFVLIARLLWDKGIGEYVEAVRIVKASYPHVVFSLVGPLGIANKTAISSTQIQEWAAQGIIDYLGETDAVRDVIASHDCIVLPSYREGMSRVLIEAAAMGKPLITTDVAGCADIVTHEVNGLLCKLQDAADLAQQMLKFIRYTPEQSAQMGVESRVRAQACFGEQQVIDAYRSAIQKAISV